MAAHDKQLRLTILLSTAFLTTAGGCGTSRVYQMSYEKLAAEFPCDRVAEETMTTCQHTAEKLRIEHDFPLVGADIETVILVEPQGDTQTRVRVDQETRVSQDLWFSPYFILGVMALPIHILDTNADEEREIIKAVNEAVRDEESVFWDVGVGRSMAGSFGTSRGVE